MSVKRKTRTSSASKKARPKKAASGKTAARKTAAKAGARKSAAPPRAAKAKTAARTASKSAKAKPAPKATRKTARTAGAGASGAHDIVDFASMRAEADRFAPHGDATGSASGGPGAQMPAGRPTGASAGKCAADGSEAHEAQPRANKLVPTNAVHTTKRRTKQSFWQSPAFGATAAVLVLLLLVVGYRPEPPEVAPMEQRADAGPESDAPSAAAAAPISDPVQAAPDRLWPRQTAATQSRTARIAAAPADTTGDAAKAPSSIAAPTAASTGFFRSGLGILDLIELERMLARLDLGPSRADGIVDRKTESAIRMYQQIAGLPVDGLPSPDLLEDMRAVVKVLDGKN